jgi:hypothetical protein
MYTGRWTLLWFLLLTGCDTSGGRERLIRVRCSHSGDFTEGYSWGLVADAGGRATLTVSVPGAPKTRELQIAKDRLARIERAIEMYHLSSLPASIGNRVPDGSARVIEIETTMQSKEINIWSVSREDVQGDAGNAIRLWDVIRGCFDDDEAFDSRPYDEKVLQQAGGGDG